MSTTEQRETIEREAVDPDGPAIAHLGHRIGDQIAFCGARIIGVQCTDGRPTCVDCERIATARRFR